VVAGTSRVIGRLRQIGRADPLLDFIVRGSFASLATRVVGIALSYVSVVVLSRTLGLAGYGFYAIALAWALVLVLPCRAGLDYAALRFASIYFERGHGARLKALVRFAALAMLSLSLLVGAGLYLLTIAGLTSIPSALAPGVALLIFPVAALGLVAVLLRTARLIAASQFYEQVLRPAILILLLAAGAVLGIRLSPANAMILTAGSAGAALVCGAIRVLHVLRSPVRPDYSPWRDWIALSFPLLITTILQELLNQLDIIILGYLGTPAAAGLYSAAWRLASLVGFGLAALTTSSGPLIASAHARRDIAEYARIATITARFSLAASLALAVPLVIAGHHILRLFGPAFGEGYPALLILLAAGLVNGFTGVVAYFLTLTGKQVQALAIFACAVVISITLNLLLIPRFSIVGAAIASASATLFWNGAMLFYVRRSFGIDASALGLPVRRSPSLAPPGEKVEP